jgi:preprotein translocase subunit SecG
MKRIITLMFVGFLAPLLSFAHTGTPVGGSESYEMMGMMTGNESGAMMNWMWGNSFLWWIVGILAVVWIVAGIIWIFFMLRQMNEEDKKKNK